jgi:hypothetical protein
VLGLCWGGKVRLSVPASTGRPWKANSLTHLIPSSLHWLPLLKRHLWPLAKPILREWHAFVLIGGSACRWPHA